MTTLGPLPKEPLPTLGVPGQEPGDAHHSQTLLLLRPRTAGEILDDAWRLAFSYSAELLLLNSLFLVPAFIVILLLVAAPTTTFPTRWLLPLLTASLLPLTGLASGACQDFFRCLLEGRPVSVKASLRTTLRYGFRHWIARSLFLGCLITGLGCLVMPGLTIWMACVSLHGLIAAGKGTAPADLRELGREARFSSLKTATVLLTRIPLLLLGVTSLHLLLMGCLWCAGTLLGLEVAFFSLQLSSSNMVYMFALTLFSWLLLAPYAEASCFLLHLDTRIRQEGLDLFYRVGRLFPLVNGARSRGALVLLIASLVVCPAALRGADFSKSLAEARQQVQEVTREIRTADPYPGSEHWSDQLERMARELEQTHPGSRRQTRWLGRALKDFDQRSREESLQILAEIEDRLGRLEERARMADVGRGGTGGAPRPTAEELHKLLRPLPDEGDEPREQPKSRQEKETPKVVRKENVPPADEPGTQVRNSGPQPSAAEGSRIGLLLVGVLLAMLGAALWLSWRRESPQASSRGDQRSQPTEEPPVSQALTIDALSSTNLWQQAERLAASGDHLEAMRELYRAVLVLLHRARLLRYEPPRTNGEYIREVRLARQAPSPLHPLFTQLIDLFERKWYGERACTAEEYATGLQVAHEIRRLVPE